tara:strand:- start:546 stop:1724 length:1179 start_codon:yes stop_codon:yes gene_type:complete
MKKDRKFLLLSYYYDPDLSAGAFRTKSLINSIMLESSKNKIFLVTTQPNRLGECEKRPTVERLNQLTVFRAPVVAFGKKEIHQLINFFIFVNFVTLISIFIKFDVINATTSKLGTGLLGAFISKLKGKPLFLDIRDIFTDTYLSLRSKNLLYKIFEKLELLAFKRATKINFVSKGFIDYYDKKSLLSGDVHTYTNGIDDLFLDHFSIKKNKQAKKITQVLYAGNIGEGQALHKVLPYIARELEDSHFFTVVGGGSLTKIFEEKVKSLNLSNFRLIEPVKRERLVDFYDESDILFLHLDDVEAFRKVLPSKLFEYGSSGKPIVAGVEGYAKTFCNENFGDGCEVFDPCDWRSAVMAFRNFQNNIPSISRQDFCHLYSRSSIMKRYAKDLISLS